MLQPLLKRRLSLYPWRHVYIRNYSNKQSQNAEPTPEQEATSAIVDRMKQILEEKISSQSASTIQTMKRTDESLNQILSKYDTPSTSLPKSKQASSYIRSEPILAHNKHAKISTILFHGVEPNLFMILI